MSLKNVSFPLSYPIVVDGKTIASVTIRRPRGRDMVMIGNSISTLMSFHQNTNGEDNTGNINTPTSEVFSAMITITSCLADLGDAAGDLDLEDLSAITAQALNAGEALGRGDAANGGD